MNSTSGLVGGAKRPHVVAKNFGGNLHIGKFGKDRRDDCGKNKASLKIRAILVGAY